MAGWTYAVKRKGVSMLDFFRDKLGDRVVDVGFVRLSEAYIVYETKGGDLTCLVANVVFTPNHPNHPGLLRYYVMEEAQGPHLKHCPEKILDQLDAPPTASARLWRQACRQYHAARADRPTLHAGDWVLFQRSLKLTGGRHEHLFRVGRHGKKRRGYSFYPVGDTPSYHIRNFRDATYFKITCREDIIDLLQHENQTVREQALRAMGLLEFHEDGALCEAP